MIDLQLRITPRMLRQVAEIERITGRLERQPALNPEDSSSLFERSLKFGSVAILRLDASATKSDLPTDTGATESDETAAFRRLLEAHRGDFTFDIAGLSHLYRTLVGLPDDAPTPYRTEPEAFSSPGLGRDSSVFQTIAPFMVETRLQELCRWFNQELEADDLHPLLLIGVVHLLLLQISPFPTANHRLALLSTWHILSDQGFLSVRETHFAQIFESRRSEYFSALRQAERTALGTWATLSMWLELFLDAILQGASTVYGRTKRESGRLRLTSVQRQIVHVIQSLGPASREQVAAATGINLSTVKYNLGVLSARGVLDRRGGGRTTSYAVIQTDRAPEIAISA